MSSDKVLDITKRSRSSVTYPAGNLANSLNLVARLIGGECRRGFTMSLRVATTPTATKQGLTSD